MIIKIFFRNDEKGAFVETKSPLTFTPDIAKGYFTELDCEIEDYDIEKLIVNDLSKFCVETISYNWSLHFIKEDGTQLVLVNFDGMGMHAYFSPEEAEDDDIIEIIKELLADLSMYSFDIITKVNILKLGKGTATTATTASTGVSGTSTTTPTTTKIDALIDSISKKTKAEIVKPTETLADYVCDDVLKAELEEIKDFFENRETYRKVNAVIPKGVLFKGLPGTGKTFAARCIAGSVDCYFMVCTASSLQGMYVGSGAQNISDVFRGARELNKASSKGVILFIDEIDSFGDRSNRSGGAGGEEDRTLNQLLAEMSGFKDDEEIMLMGATNFPDGIDSALLRSGRFSRQITIDLPNADERKNLLEHYFTKIKFDIAGTDYFELAELTENLTPADIKEISNESAILTIRNKKSEMGIDLINDAINKVLIKDIKRKDGRIDIKLVSAHEAGHVLAEILFSDTTPVKVTSFSYGNAGGFTQSSMKKTGLWTKDNYIAEIKMLLAGRVGEVLMTGTVTNGASDDLRKAKHIIKDYYEKFNFANYKVKEIDQIVVDSLDTYFNETLEEFSKEENLETLKKLTDELYVKRVLYAKDINLIVTKIKGIGDIL